MNMSMVKGSGEEGRGGGRGSYFMTLLIMLESITKVLKC